MNGPSVPWWRRLVVHFSPGLRLAAGRDVGTAPGGGGRLGSFGETPLYRFPHVGPLLQTQKWVWGVKFAVGTGLGVPTHVPGPRTSPARPRAATWTFPSRCAPRGEPRVAGCWESLWLTPRSPLRISGPRRVTSYPEGPEAARWARNARACFHRKAGVTAGRSATSPSRARPLTSNARSPSPPLSDAAPDVLACP